MDKKREVEIINFDDLDNTKKEIDIIEIDEIDEKNISLKKDKILKEKIQPKSNILKEKSKNISAKNDNLKKITNKKAEITKKKKIEDIEKIKKAKNTPKRKLKSPEKIVNTIKEETIKKEKEIVEKTPFNNRQYFYMFSVSIIIIIGTLICDFYMNLGLFKIEKEEILLINEYRISSTDVNLYLYSNNSFNFTNNNHITTGKYSNKKNEITLKVKNYKCTLKKINNILISDCNFINTNNQKSILFLKSSEDINLLKTIFLDYINGLIVFNKMPSLNSSRVNKISNCYSISEFTFICNINYVVSPVVLINSPWIENGIVVNNEIKKQTIGEFEYANNHYKFVNIK